MKNKSALSVDKDVGAHFSSFLLLCFLFQSIREVQTSLRDGVILFRALLDEVRRNMEAERDGIMTTYAKLIDTLKKQYEVLIKDLERYVRLRAHSDI